jgi:hypothetical protein
VEDRETACFYLECNVIRSCDTAHNVLVHVRMFYDRRNTGCRYKVGFTMNLCYVYSTSWHSVGVVVCQLTLGYRYNIPSDVHGPASSRGLDKAGPD